MHQFYTWDIRGTTNLYLMYLGDCKPKWDTLEYLNIINKLLDNDGA